MSDILEKLKALGVTKGMPSAAAKQPARQNKTDGLNALRAEFPSGIVVENEFGPCFINRLRHPLSEPHGEVDMSMQLAGSSLFDAITGMSIPSKEETLAFDTETSGLSNGSGSFIFMLGLGYFEDADYIVDQLILPDLSYEKAFLRQTELIFSRYSNLLSYNGKSFDVPMLQSRLNFHLFPDFTRDIQHLDLLYITRRYWKPTLGRVPLSNIEKYVMKLQRGDEEVPGYMAPDLYRDFLRSGDASNIAGVAYHNWIDVVSLSAFLIYLNDLCRRGGEDLSVWEKNGVPEKILLRHHPDLFSAFSPDKLDAFSEKEKKAIALKFIKNGETEKAEAILEFLAEKGDADSAHRLMKMALKDHEEERFERYKDLTILLLQSDETLGYWSGQEKIKKIRAVQFK